MQSPNEEFYACLDVTSDVSVKSSSELSIVKCTVPDPLSVKGVTFACRKVATYWLGCKVENVTLYGTDKSVQNCVSILGFELTS